MSDMYGRSSAPGSPTSSGHWPQSTASRSMFSDSWSSSVCSTCRYRCASHPVVWLPLPSDIRYSRAV
eukprot:5061395-Amphidinium_carterae.1